MKNQNIFITTTIIVFILFFILFLSINKYHEYFSMENFEDLSGIDPNKPYLFPTKGLQKLCQSQGYEPAYGPQSCFKDGQFDPYANCQCVDKQTGFSTVCYPNIEKDERTSSIIYNANKF